MTKWKKQLTESGLRGLKARRPPRKLSANQCQRLVSMLKLWDRSPAYRAKRVRDYLATQLSLNGCHHTPRISTRRNTVKTASKELDTRANPTWN